MPYRKIIYICYEGKNYNLIQEQINLFNSYSYQSNRRSLDYTNEIYEFLCAPKGNIFKGFNHSKSNDKVTNQTKRSIQKEIHEDRDDKRDFLDNIRNILKTDDHYTIYKEYEENISKIEDNFLEMNKRSLENLNEISEVFYRIRVKTVGDDKIIEKISTC